jgi:hypothetical protein
MGNDRHLCSCLEPTVVGGTMSAKAIGAAAVLLLFLWQPSDPGFARERTSAAKTQNDNDKDEKDEIDTEEIFGFTEGSDVGEAGEKEVELEPFGRFGKRSGRYAAASSELSFKYTPFDNFRVAPAISFASHNISNVPGLDNLNQFTFQGVGVDLRYRLLDREHAPFGLTLAADLQRNRIDEMSGLLVEQYAIEFAALFDKELVPGRLFAALNLLYEPEWERERATGEWERESTIGIGAALALQVASGFFIGAEARYLRKYEGAALNTFLGEALFVGPTIYVKLPHDWFAAATWNVQVAGRAVGEPFSLDLTNFERHEVLFKLGVQLGSASMRKQRD